MLQLIPRSQDGKVRVYDRATGKHLDRFPPAKRTRVVTGTIATGVNFVANLVKKA